MLSPIGRARPRRGTRAVGSLPCVLAGEPAATIGGAWRVPRGHTAVGLAAPVASRPPPAPGAAGRPSLPDRRPIFIIEGRPQAGRYCGLRPRDGTAVQRV